MKKLFLSFKSHFIHAEIFYITIRCKTIDDFESQKQPSKKESDNNTSNLHTNSIYPWRNFVSTKNCFPIVNERAYFCASYFIKEQFHHMIIKMQYLLSNEKERIWSHCKKLIHQNIDIFIVDLNNLLSFFLSHDE